MPARVGVMALQGAFVEHLAMLDRLGAQGVEVRRPAELAELDGLIIPGGESTTISLLMSEYGFFTALQDMARSGFPLWGTCAGLILLARLPGSDRPRTLRLMDIEVERNAYGRQVDSFEADLQVPAIGEGPFHGVFIRAPRISAVGQGVSVLSQLPNGGGPVAARQEKLLCCSFHPELTTDTRLHRYFLGMIAGTS